MLCSTNLCVSSVALIVYIVNAQVAFPQLSFVGGINVSNIEKDQCEDTTSEQNSLADSQNGLKLKNMVGTSDLYKLAGADVT